jgi:hypothetical protein
MNADSREKLGSMTFAGFSGFLQLTLIVFGASFLIGLAYGVAVLGGS